jgi:hypothetical protein
VGFAVPSRPAAIGEGWSLYPILTWRTGFPFTVTAGLPTQDLGVNAQDVGTASAPGTFGQAISAYDPRILQVAAHVRF